MRTRGAKARRAAAWLTQEQPWQRGPWYWVPAFTLSVAFGLGIGATIGLMVRGLPYWLPILGVAIAACLARTFVDVQTELEHERTHGRPPPPKR